MDKRRFLSAFLAALMLIGVTACGNGGNTPSADATTAATASAETTTEPVTEPPEYVPPTANYNGQKITFTGYSYTGNWAILRYNVGLHEENGEVLNDAIARRNRQVEEELNVKLEMIPLASGDRSKSTVLQKYVQAQEDVLTFAMQMEAGLSSILTTKGMVLNLKEIPALDLDASWWNQNANEEYTIYGTQYAAVGDMCLLNLGAPVVVYFSKDLIKSNGLDDPYKLVYDGKWTIDAMKTLAAKAASDVNGDGAPDKDDVFGFATEMASLYYAMFSAGIRYSDRDKDGTLKAALYNEKSVSAVEKIVPFIRDKKTTMYYEDWKAGYSNAHSDFFMPKLMDNELLFYSNQLLVTLNLREMESDFGIVPMPKYDEKQEQYYSIANTYFSDHIVVPATNARGEQTGNVLNAMGYYAKEYVTPAFIEQSIVLKGLRDEDSLTMINMILDNEIFDVGLIFDWGGMTQMLLDLVIRNDTNLASSWATIEEKVNTALNATVTGLKG